MKGFFGTAAAYKFEALFMWFCQSLWRKVAQALWEASVILILWLDEILVDKGRMGKYRSWLEERETRKIIISAQAIRRESSREKWH